MRRLALVLMVLTAVSCGRQPDFALVGSKDALAFFGDSWLADPRNPIPDELLSDSEVVPFLVDGRPVSPLDERRGKTLPLLEREAEIFYWQATGVILSRKPPYEAMEDLWIEPWNRSADGYARLYPVDICDLQARLTPELYAGPPIRPDCLTDPDQEPVIPWR